MNPLRSMTHHAQEYLAVRRAMGVELRIAGRQLLDFAAFADRAAHGKPLTVDLALRWACASGHLERIGQARRLEIIRPFARYLSTICPRTEIPPARLLGYAHRRKPAYIYSSREVQELLAVAGRLVPRGGLRPATIRTYLALLACTGMRPREPIRLTRDDVDFEAGTVLVRRTKFYKSRIVALHSSAVQALRAYARFRDQHVPMPQAPAFFLVDGGQPLTPTKLRAAFDRLRHELGWTVRTGRKRPPRLYDLRHTFISRRLLTWYKDKVDVHTVMHVLATYVGHVKVTDTYWYITGIPELLALIGERFEQFAGPRKER